MHARVTILPATSGDVDLAIDAFQEETVPRLRRLDGYCGAYLLVDRESRKALAVTLWETPEAMAASEEAAGRLRTEAARQLLSTPLVERYEVAVAEEGPELPPRLRETVAREQPAVSP